MQAYRRMKHSGVPSIGNLPIDWGVIRPSVIFRERREKSSSTDIHLTPSQKYGVLPQQEYMRISGSRVVLNLTGSDNMKHVESGDFVIHLRSFQGGIEYSPYKGKVSNAYTILQPNKQVHCGYFKYVLKSYGFISDLASTTDQLRDGQSIKFSTFDLVKLPLPSAEIQERIANYLDQETAKIDELITKQERLLALLEEKRRATITHSVARVFCENEVKNWTEERIRYVCELNPSTPQKFLNTDEVSFYPMESVGDDGVVVHEETRNYEEVKAGYTIFRNGDVVLAKVTPCFENYKAALMVGVKSEIGFGSTELFVLRPKAKVLPEFLYQITQTSTLNNYLAGGMRGTGGLKRVVPEELKNYKFYLPDLDEQKEIVRYIKRAEQTYNELRHGVKRQIALLKERRTSLISHAVTGKIKV